MEKHKKRILYLSPNGYLGGAEKFVLDACRGHQSSDKFETEILFFNDGEAINRASDLGLTISLLSFQVRLRNPLSVIRAIFFIRKKLRKDRFDIIHATMPYSHIFASFAAIGTRVKKVWFQHGPVGGILDRIAAILPVDEIFFNSIFLKNEHEKSTPFELKPNSWTIIPLGVEKELAEIDITSSYKSDSDQLLVGMVGRITQWKGFHVFIDAIDHLKQHYNDTFEQVKFLIVGDAKTEKDKAYDHEIREMVVLKGLADSVYFLGYRADVANIFSSLDVFVHASIIPEPFGYVIAEAMQYDVIVIGSNYGGVEELLRDGETGISYESTAPDAYVLLAKKMEEVITGYQQLTYLRDNARHFVGSNFSYQNMIEILENRYLSLLT